MTRAVLTSVVVFLSGCAAAMTTLRPPTGEGPASLSIHNQSGRPIHHAYMTPSSETGWADDLLQSAILAPGAAFRVDELAAGRWDIRVVNPDGRWWAEWRNLRFDAGGAYELEVEEIDWQR